MNKPERTTMSKNEYYILKDGCTDKIIMKNKQDKTTCIEFQTNDEKKIKSNAEEMNASK